MFCGYCWTIFLFEKSTCNYSLTFGALFITSMSRLYFFFFFIYLLELVSSTFNGHLHTEKKKSETETFKKSIQEELKADKVRVKEWVRCFGVKQTIWINSEWISYIKLVKKWIERLKGCKLVSFGFSKQCQEWVLCILVWFSEEAPEWALLLLCTVCEVSLFSS